MIFLNQGKVAMSDLNARFNSTNLTLQDFKNIAENNNANAEVRIKKSDGKLSTSPEKQT